MIYLPGIHTFDVTVARCKCRTDLDFLSFRDTRAKVIATYDNLLVTTFSVNY